MNNINETAKTGGMYPEPNPAKRLSVEAAKNGWIVSRVREGCPPVNYVCANEAEASACVHQLITTGRVDLSNNSAVRSESNAYERALYHSNQEVERLRTVLDHRQKEAIDTIAKLKLEGITEANRRADAESKLRTALDKVAEREERLKTAATAWDQGYAEGGKQVKVLTMSNTLAKSDIAGLRTALAAANQISNGWEARAKDMEGSVEHISQQLDEANEQLAQLPPLRKLAGENIRAQIEISELTKQRDQALKVIGQVDDAYRVGFKNGTERVMAYITKFSVEVAQSIDEARRANQNPS
jgi:FtsZ-binding cell division protein ZapB